MLPTHSADLRSRGIPLFGTAHAALRAAASPGSPHEGQTHEAKPTPTSSGEESPGAAERSLPPPRPRSCVFRTRTDLYKEVSKPKRCRTLKDIRRKCTKAAASRCYVKTCPGRRKDQTSRERGSRPAGRRAATPISETKAFSNASSPGCRARLPPPPRPPRLPLGSGQRSAAAGPRGAAGGGRAAAGLDGAAERRPRRGRG
ncbi:uncharacterized protein LOC110407165 [Numida meleagris]|uniref:uncharacterized protein LOC110407165 n=1 Tax=Numida meleagris TaxID=8996 RepID=UPI000B3D913C|nr:uncharacterized protein LOC110407165 [Numida meleagris]